MRPSVFVASLACLFAASPVVRAGAPTVETVWMTNFASAEAEAQRLHRPLVVHFHGKSCPPCRAMERDVLHTPQVLKVLEEGFVAVKVDLNDKANSRLAAKYKVISMPTDIILGDEGKVLSRTEASPGLSRYVANLKAIDAKYLTDDKRIARSDAPPSKPEVATRNEAPVEAPPANVRQDPSRKLVPDPVEPQQVATTAPQTKTSAPPRAPATVAMDGYCPVTLRTTRGWKAGRKDLALEHDGQLYYFASPETRRDFQSNPSRFAPKLMGCDPVTLSDSDLAIRGSTKFGAYFDGELYLFETSESRAKFRKDPARYTRMKHALKPQDIKEARNLASTTTVK